MDAVSATVPSLQRLLDDTRERSSVTERFSSESQRTVRIEVDGSVWIAPGAAIAYRGDLAFERRPTLAAHSIGDALMREASPFVRASGRGRLYCGNHGAHARVVRLDNQSLVVASSALLAFESSLAFSMALVEHGIGIAAGGIVGVTLSGSGAFALATHGEPLSLDVSAGDPVTTDPHATLAWSVSLAPALKTDVSWRSAFGHGGHEPIQMWFEGAGSVLVQPFEHSGPLAVHAPSLKQLARLVTA